MAINKTIKDNNGVTVEYHRVSKITSIINCVTIIEITSYISNDDRLIDKANPSFNNVYKSGIFYDMSYDPEFTVIKAYEYIKGLPEFEGAVDV